MTMISPRLCLGWVVAVIVAGGPAPVASGGNDDRDALAVLAAAYANNRGAFEIVDCRFDVVRSRADTVSAAVRGEFSQSDVPRRGHWLVNREYTRYELLCDPNVIADVKNALKRQIAESTNKHKYTSIACQDEYHLGKARGYSLAYSSLISGANLFTSDDAEGPGIRITPFSMNVMGNDESSNPVRYIESAVRGDFPGHYIGFEKSESGRDMVVCEVGPDRRVRMGFDPERGYMLTMMSDRDHKRGAGRLYVAYVLDAKQCSNGAWFPMRTVTISNPDSPGSLIVERINTVNVDTEVAPVLDRFAIDLPAGVQVNRVGHPEWFSLNTQESVSISDLPSLHRRCTDHGKPMEAVAEKEARAKTSPVAKPHLFRVFTALNLVLVSLVVYGCFVRWLRRSRNIGSEERSGN